MKPFESAAEGTDTHIVGHVYGGPIRRILYTALDAGHVCLLVLLVLEVLTDSTKSGTGWKSFFVF